MRRIKTIQGGRKEIEKYTGHKKSILAVAVNTAGTLVASADESGKIIVWNQDLGIRFYKQDLYVGLVNLNHLESRFNQLVVRC